MQCNEARRILAAATAGAAPDAVLAAHLTGCAECRQAAAGLEALERSLADSNVRASRALQAALLAVPARERRMRILVPLTVPLAGIACALGAGVIWLMLRLPGSGVASLPPVAAPATVAAPASTARIADAPHASPSTQPQSSPAPAHATRAPIATALAFAAPSAPPPVAPAAPRASPRGSPGDDMSPTAATGVTDPAPTEEPTGTDAGPSPSPVSDAGIAVTPTGAEFLPPAETATPEGATPPGASPPPPEQPSPTDARALPQTPTVGIPFPTATQGPRATQPPPTRSPTATITPTLTATHTPTPSLGNEGHARRRSDEASPSGLRGAAPALWAGTVAWEPDRRGRPRRIRAT
jgi:hypothetical protein